MNSQPFGCHLQGMQVFPWFDIEPIDHILSDPTIALACSHLKCKSAA